MMVRFDAVKTSAAARIGRIAAIGALAAQGMLAGGAFAAEPVTVRVNANPVPYQSPLFVAQAKGFDAKHNLKIEFIGLAGGPQNAPGLLNGTLDIASCTFNNVANFAEQGKSVVAFYKLVERPTLDLVVGQNILKSGVAPNAPLAQRYAALKGKKFGISDAGGPSDVFLRALLSAAKIDANKDVEIIRVGSIAGLFAALKSGQIDGYVLSPPSPQQAEKAGAGKVFIRLSAGEVPELSQFPSVAICATTDYEKKNPQVLRNFAKALQEADTWMRANVDETAKIGNKLFKGVPAATWHEGTELLLPAVSKTGVFEPGEVEKAYTFYKTYGAITTIPAVAEDTTWTNKYVK